MTYIPPVTNPHWPEVGPKYWLQAQSYFSERYGEWIDIPDGHPSDGATGFLVPDIPSSSWQFHDVICSQEQPRWRSGKRIYPHQAALVLGDILHAEGRHLRDKLWPWGTLLMGCRSTWRNVLDFATGRSA